MDADEFSPEKAGKQWEFDWFSKAKIPLEPSLPRSVVVPTWELPFRRRKKESEQGEWEPSSVQVFIACIPFVLVLLHKCSVLAEDAKSSSHVISLWEFCPKL